MKTKFKFLATMLIGILLSTNVWGTIADGTYVLCTSTSDLKAGDHYIIANGTSGEVKCISKVENNNNRKIVDATVSESKITVDENSTIMTLTLGGTSGAWTFYTDNYKGDAGYLASASSGSNNHCRVISTSTTATISFNNDAAVITLNPHTSRNILRYNSSATCFACYSSGQAAVYLYHKSSAPAHTITAQSNNVAYGTVSLNGSTITGSPNTGYTYASPAYTVTTGTATVVQNGNEFTVTPETDCTVRINFAAKQTATITLMEAGTPVAGPSGKYSGETYTLPSSVTNVCDGKTFVGWSTVDIPMPGDKPTENYYDKGDEVTLAATNTFYAVYAEVTGGSTGASEGTTLWGENFAHFGTNTPSGAGTGTGTTIYGGASIVYAQGSTSTHAYNETNAGGTAPELLLTKNNYQWWSIAGIKTGEAKEMTLTYKTNKENSINITIDKIDEQDKFDVAQDETDKKKWTLTVKDGETVDNFTLNFWNNKSEDANIRLDDIVLVVSQTGATYSNYTTCGSKYSVTFKNQESVISTTEYTAGTVIHAPATAENTCGDGFFFVGWLAQPLYVGATPNPKPAGLIQPNGEITVPAADVVYYAVFAQKRIN